jgi:hypothetical protein
MKVLSLYKLGVLAFAVGTGSLFGQHYQGGQHGQQGKQSKKLAKLQAELSYDLREIKKTAVKAKRIAKHQIAGSGYLIANKATKVVNRAEAALIYVGNLQKGGINSGPRKAKRIKHVESRVAESVRELRQSVRASRAGVQAPKIRQVLQKQASALYSFKATVQKTVVVLQQSKSSKVICKAKDTREYNNPFHYQSIGFERYTAQQQAIAKCRVQSSAYRPNCVIVGCKVL